ncbi:MAG: sugar transferase [Actinomycetota bacterium]
MTTDDADSGRGSMIGDSGRIAAAVILSRITGLLRIVVAASVLGATVLGDLFVAVNVLPLTLYDVLAGSAISSVLVPPLVRLGAERARRLAGLALGTLAAGMGVVAVVGILTRDLIAGALTAGVDRAIAGDARAVAALLVALIVPQLVVYAVIGVLVAVQHANRRFLLPSAAPVVENVGLLATIGVAWWRYGSGLEVDRAPTGLVLTLAIGSGLSVLAHATVQLVGAARATGMIRPRLGLRDPDLRALVEPARASFGWSSMVAARQFALVVAAAWAGAGGVQAFEMALLVSFIPMAVFGRPIASAALPRLAGWSDEPTRLLAAYRSCLRLAAWLAVPAGLAMVALARPLAELIGQGRFATPRATELLTLALAGLGLGALSEALFEVARQTVMAVGPDGAGTRRRGLVASTWLRLTVAVVGLPVAVLLVDGPALLLALGLVVSLADLGALVLVHRSLRLHPGWATSDADGRRLGHGVRVLAASAAALGPVVAVDRLLEPTWSPTSAVAAAGFAAVGYVLAAWLVTGRGRTIRDLLAGLEDPMSTESARPRSVAARVGATEPAPIGSEPGERWATGPAEAGQPGRMVADLTGRVRSQPAALIAVYLMAMPFLAGLPRGSLLPAVRPSEALQGAVTAIAVTAGAAALVSHRRWRVRVQPLEWWLLALVVTSSVGPALWLLARGRDLGASELLSTLPFLKYAALYVLVRALVRSRHEVDAVVGAAVASASVIAVISVAQAVGVGPVIAVLERFFVSSADDVIDGGRGTTTIGSSIATGAYLSLAAGLALSRTWITGRMIWGAATALCLAGALASGQAGTLVALAVIVPAVAHRHGRLGQVVRLSLPVGAIGLVGLSTVVAARLTDVDPSSGLPISWLIRWNNLSELYLPDLRSGGWLLGVSPDAVVVPPDVWRTTVYLESGYLWLLWVGGVPLLIAAVGFLVATWRAMAPERGDVEPRRGIDTVRSVARPAVAMMAVLSLIDPHLTLRAGADLFFVVIALGSAGRPLLVPAVAAPDRWRTLLGVGRLGDPATRLRLGEIAGAADPADLATPAPEVRLAITTAGDGRVGGAVELDLHRRGRHLHGVLGPVDAADDEQRALLWRSVALVGRSLRLQSLRIDQAEPALAGATAVAVDELRSAAGLARRLERRRVLGPRRIYRVRRADGDSAESVDRPAGIDVDGAPPPVRLEPWIGISPIKRLLDVVTAGLAMVVAAPLLGLVALLVRRSGPGPIVFRQVRIGAGGLPFQMAKFRTMHTDNDDSAHRAQNRREILDGAGAVKDEHDPRITRIGGVLRRLSLDELPQLVNVLRGEMSLVGPRPSLLWESELFPPRLRRRLTTRPGLTGLWQVSGRADLSMNEMLELDLDYVERASLGLDLRCLARTATSVLAREGAK